MLRFFKITGNSMQPTITPGSYVVTTCFDKYNIDDLIVLQINEQHHIVKRVTAQIEAKYQISSDNKNISSSLCDYTYSHDAIIGKVILILNPIWKFSRFVKCVKNLVKYDRKYANGNN